MKNQKNISFFEHPVRDAILVENKCSREHGRAVRYATNLKIPIIILSLAALFACNEDNVFEKEQYKTVLALVSEDGFNIFRVVHDLDEPESVGYVAASCGGTRQTEYPVEIVLSPDMESFDRYNTSNFDVDAAKYAHLLPAGKYDIASYRLTIPAGERSGKMPINVRPDGLSPDSTYFIPLAIEYYDRYEANPDKSNVLYQVLLKNQYATQEYPTNYTMRAFRGDVQLPGLKTMHPISRNKVRTFVDNFAFEADMDIINRYAIVLEITADNRVLISSWKDIEVTRIDDDPDFPNIFFIEDTGFKKYKTFLLRYDYKNVNGLTIEMKEELRLEFTE